jgi:hypothetical protein
LTIRYANGLTKESILLSRTKDSLRVAIQGCDDVTELRQVNGTWITDECEPVQVTFAWQQDPTPETTEADCICPSEFAARLIHVLYVAEEEDPKPLTSALSLKELLSPLVV